MSKWSNFQCRSRRKKLSRIPLDGTGEEWSLRKQRVEDEGEDSDEGMEAAFSPVTSGKKHSGKLFVTVK